jgi:hypothetical protein
MELVSYVVLRVNGREMPYKCCEVLPTPLSVLTGCRMLRVVQQLPPSLPPYLDALTPPIVPPWASCDPTQHAHVHLGYTDVTSSYHSLEEEEEESFLQLTKPVSQTFGLGFEPLLGLMTRCLLPSTLTFLILLGVTPTGMTCLPFLFRLLLLFLVALTHPAITHFAVALRHNRHSSLRSLHTFSKITSHGVVVVSLCPTWKTRPLYLYPPEAGWLPILVASYDTHGLRWGYSYSPVNTRGLSFPFAFALLDSANIVTRLRAGQPGFNFLQE